MRRIALISLVLSLTWAGAAQPPSPYPMVPATQLDSQRERDDPFFLDVRSNEELAELGTLEGYHHIPLDELESRLEELPRDRPILTA